METDSKGRDEGGTKADADWLEAATDQAIAACRGNVRDAVKALIVANEFLEMEMKQLQAAVSNGYARGRFEPGPRDMRDQLCGHADNSAGAAYVHGGSVEAMKAAIELLTFDGFAVASCWQGILSERRPQAIRSLIRIIATALLTLDEVSLVFLLQVQTKFFLAVNGFPSWSI